MFEGLFQPMHLIIILGIALIVFGPGKLPELGKGLGKGIREFKKAMSDTEEDNVKEMQKKITSPGSVAINKEAAQVVIEERRDPGPEDIS